MNQPKPRVGDASTSASTQRPKDAATLILVKADAKTSKVLMGKRSAGHVFMPDKYVFPGGRVEPGDGRVPSRTELSAHNEALLRYRSRRRPRAFALSAIRETFEETGLIVGTKGVIEKTIPCDWQEYFSHGALPCLESIQFVGRAITPPGRARRFDARFFMADANLVLLNKDAGDSRELIDVKWLDLQQARTLELPTITRIMLDEVAALIANPSAKHQPRFMRQLKSGYTNDIIRPDR